MKEIKKKQETKGRKNELDGRDKNIKERVSTVITVHRGQ